PARLALCTTKSGALRLRTTWRALECWRACAPSCHARRRLLRDRSASPRRTSILLQLPHEALQPFALRLAAGCVHAAVVLVDVEVPRHEAHLVVGGDAEVDGVVVRSRPVAGEAEALAGRDTHRRRVPGD